MDIDHFQGFAHSSAGKESACNAGDPSLITDQEDSLEKGQATHLVFLGFPGGSDGKESACNTVDLGSIPGLGTAPGDGHGNPLKYSCLENPHGQRSLAGYSPCGQKEPDKTERLITAQAQCMAP